jgi:hypothetical protein
MTVDQQARALGLRVERLRLARNNVVRWAVFRDDGTLSAARDALFFTRYADLAAQLTCSIGRTYGVHVG